MAPPPPPQGPAKSERELAITEAVVQLQGTPVAQTSKEAIQLPTPQSPTKPEGQQTQISHELGTGGELTGKNVDDGLQSPVDEHADSGMEMLFGGEEGPAGQTAIDAHQDSAGEESEDDVESMLRGEEDSDWIPGGEEDPMDLYFDDVEGSGKPALTVQEDEPATGAQDIIMKDIDNATPDDLLARTVLNLLTFMRESAESSGVPLSRYGFTIAPEWTLHLGDVLSLHYLEGYENEAWFTDNVMHTVLDLETGKPDDVHIECHLDHFLSGDYGEIWETQLAAANRGEEPALGWPLTDMKATHNRMVAVINPSAAHWVAVEFIRATATNEPTRLLYYNSLQSASEKGPTYNAVTKLLPQVIYLASLRPNSSLAGFDPHKLEVEVVPCPQQYGSFDCGPFALYFATKRIYDKPVWRDLYDEDEKHEFGQYLRRQCAYVLQNNRMGADHLLSLREYLDALQQREAAEAQQERDREQQRAANEELERALAAEAESLDPDVLAAEAEQALLTQYLDAERVGVQYRNSESISVNPLIQSKPGLPHVEHSGVLGWDLDDDPEGEAGETGSRKTPWNIFERLEYGERSDVTPSVIFIMRWSGRSSKVPSTLDQLKETAQAWIDLYLRATGRSDSNTHVIIHAATNIPTVYMPWSDDFDRSEECLSPAEEPVDPPSDTSDNTQLSYDCPLCHVTASYESVKYLLYDTYIHIGSHSVHISDSMIQKKAGRYVVSCPETDCPAVSSSTTRTQLRKNARQHWGRKHGVSWLEEQGKSLSFSCNCATCIATGLTWTVGDFLGGQKGKYSKSHPNETNLLCPYGDSKTRYSGEKYLSRHVSRLHWNDAAPPGWYQCDYDAIDPSTQCWKSFPCHLKTRLAWDSRPKCAWAAAGADFCTEDDDSCSEKQLLAHYNKQHGDELWPYTVDGMFKCSRLFPDKGKLLQHETQYHNVQDTEKWRRLRAATLTSAIIEDLQQLASKHSPTPILLTLGFDGFTCNTARLLVMLQNVDLRFQLAICTNDIYDMDRTHFTRIDRSYFGFYDSETIRTYLEDRSCANDKYLQLFEVWDGLQQGKDLQSRFRRHRNVLPKIR
ncbi:hypothetical protein HBI56_006100 [Parastagonospora nodorum]|nr:hypothetical protein HBH51_038020 [Parastagonospora nodorum]KAH4041927.1 hypothetical protein HBI09_006420 [Parastagonospora nodorum]KAH4111086.1 hypothetical protein HBH46_006070 [Parastagonospora nodorum]KAH4200326.1 hypothetical protein HBH42_042590 [Parastagonospora nodorum]KAH4234823.1 hypothetical protein HBI06_054650 [Parastagonospora nodorum]